jgi:hypothetical protein
MRASSEAGEGAGTPTGAADRCTVIVLAEPLRVNWVVEVPAVMPLEAKLPLIDPEPLRVAPET